MSHFSVLVVTSEPPTDEVLEKTLAPWHEFECTGRDDQYVVEIDKTEEARAAFEKAKETRLRDTEGNLHDLFDDQGNWKPEFSRPDNDRFRSGRKEFIPEGYEKIEIAASEVMSFGEWAADYYGWPMTAASSVDRADRHKYGHIVVDEAGNVIRCIDRTNPNAKWDWWQVGGRYSGRLAAGYDPEKDPDNQEICFLCAGTGKRCDTAGNVQREIDPSYSCNGCSGKGISVKWPSSWKNVGNTARWGDLDISKLKASAEADRRAMVDEMRAKARLSAEDFEAGYHAYKDAHQLWMELPEPRPRGAEFHDWLKTQAHGELGAAYRDADMWGAVAPSEGQTIEEWIMSAPAVSAYAAIIDGKWCAHGEMGWFGMSSDKSDDWPAQLQAIVERIPAEHYVAFVDCHI